MLLDIFLSANLTEHLVDTCVVDHYSFLYWSIILQNKKKLTLNSSHGKAFYLVYWYNDQHCFVWKHQCNIQLCFRFQNFNTFFWNIANSKTRLRKFYAIVNQVTHDKLSLETSSHALCTNYSLHSLIITLKLFSNASFAVSLKAEEHSLSDFEN